MVEEFIKLMRLTFCERSDTKCLVELIPTKEGSGKVYKEKGFLKADVNYQ
jgi:hypothetical protein